MKVLFLSILILFNSSAILNAQNLSKAYFAGGCFWCMEESFENLNGVAEVISGYSGGITKNPTYREVTYGDTCLLYTSRSPRDKRQSRMPSSA